MGTAAVCRGAWVERARAAAEALTKIERRPTPTRRLLTSIWKAYQPQPDKDPAPFLATAELLAKLHIDPDEDWNTLGPGGRPITAAWLRERLRHLLEPEGTQRPDHAGPRGYAFRQFASAFARYIGPTLPVDPVYSIMGSPEASGPAGQTVQKPSKPAKKSGPDGRGTASDGHAAGPDDGAQAVGTQPIEKADKQLEDGANGPSGPDVSGKLYEDNIEAAPPRQQAHRRRKSSKGEAAPDLDLPPAPIPPYQPGTWDAVLVDEVRRLHQENPRRSIAWLGKRTGQPKSVVPAILRPAGGAG